MAVGNLERCIELIFGHEGGYVNHPRDPGGATKYGITARTLGSYRRLGRAATPSEVKHLTLAEATSILRKQYASPVRFDDLPLGLDYAVFDYAVNSGPNRAVKDLQRVLKVRADGTMGENTLAAINGRDLSDLINDYMDRRLSFLQRLRTWSTFGRGWGRRVREVRNGALSMADKVEIFNIARVKDGYEVADPNDRKVSTRTDVRSASVAGAGAIGGAVTEAAEQLAPFAAWLPILKWVFIILLLVGVSFTLYHVIKKRDETEEG